MADDESLIEAVRSFECLRKVRSKAYKDLRAKENAWKVADEVSLCHNEPTCTLYFKVLLCLLNQLLLSHFLCRLVKLVFMIARDDGRAFVTSTFVS